MEEFKTFPIDFCQKYLDHLLDDYFVYAEKHIFTDARLDRSFYRDNVTVTFINPESTQYFICEINVGFLTEHSIVSFFNEKGIYFVRKNQLLEMLYG